MPPKLFKIDRSIASDFTVLKNPTFIDKQQHSPAVGQAFETQFLSGDQTKSLVVAPVFLPDTPG